MCIISFHSVDDFVGQNLVYKFHSFFILQKTPVFSYKGLILTKLEIEGYLCLLAH